MAGRTCPACGEPAPDDASWCEACGADLSAEPATPCVACGALQIDDDGYCMSCGHKQPDPRDHVEVSDGTAVAVSDRGVRHHHNEDAVAVGMLDEGVVLVVCDGVSSTAGSAEASTVASAAAVAHLRAALAGALDEDGAPTPPDDATLVAALQEATAAAQDAAASVADGVSEAERAAARQAGPPSSTFVAGAAVERPEDGSLSLAVAWLGDSRAYWLGADGAELLTQDHEVAGSLVRWIGADSGRVPPDVISQSVTAPGRLLLCSDGLWRYADPASELQALVERLEAEGAVNDLELARRLTEHAITGGGHDNISVAIWSWQGVSAAEAVGQGREEAAS
ncbi:MAG: protein phosphatase 2C domain-containing protein [Actinomycetota bacterium]